MNMDFLKYDEPTEKLAKEMIKEVLDNFTEREIVMKDEDFIQSNFIF
jgi:ABC-type polar amino acid transport system ATPase subunit